MGQTTKSSRIIKAPPEEVYSAFMNPKALETWQAPGNMSAKVHNFDPGVDGGYEMSLYYPDTETKMKGKTAEKEDKYTARFIELIPNSKIVESIKFHTTSPEFSKEMIVEVSFTPVDEGTRVTFLFKNLPNGIKPEDNEAGTDSSLEKLANFVENKNNQ